DIDRAISKADGTHTYFASDIAYHNNKIKRGFTKLINIWGADHAGYVARLRGAVNALTANTSTVEIILCQLVKLFRDNKPVKMSKRNNDYITIDEVVDEVGPDPIRFMMLFRKADAPLDFDFVKVCDKSKENPVFYVQYAHARIHSVFRNWNEANDKKFHDVISNFDSNFDLLIDTNEINIIKNMCYYPMVIRNALDTNDIHKIAYYLHELASEFHSLWNHGNDNSEKRFIIENQELTEQRLCLIYCVAGVIKSGMDILGVSCPESM
ncbi:MAG: DALR anticodon-binding domain-containing protein, partial [Hyphomicrobiales bacterium]